MAEHHSAGLSSQSFLFVRVSKHLESLHGTKWKDKVSPASTSARTDSSASKATVDGAMPHPIPTQSARGVTNQPHPTPAGASASRTPQATPASNGTSLAASAQPSPPEDASGSTSSATHPSPVTNSSTVQPQEATGETDVDPAVRFSQCKDKGNSLVKQVSIRTKMFIITVKPPLSGHPREIAN